MPNMIGIILKLSKTDMGDIFSVSQIVERKYILNVGYNYGKAVLDEEKISIQ